MQHVELSGFGTSSFTLEYEPALVDTFTRTIWMRAKGTVVADIPDGSSLRDPVTFMG